MSDNYMQQYGAKLMDGGYRIIPIMPGTKRPGRWDGKSWGELARWTEVNVQQVHIDLWSKWPGCGIGILCGEVIAIDIDILEAEVAVEVGKVFQKHLGEAELMRIGKAPKALYLYRTDEPFTKISMHPIEVLAAAYAALEQRNGGAKRLGDLARIPLDPPLKSRTQRLVGRALAFVARRQLRPMV